MFSSLRRLAPLPAALLLSAAFSIGKAFAAGRNWAGDPPEALPGTGGPEGLRRTIEQVLNTALTFLALLAAIVIVIAGVRLIFSMGDEEGKETAKKTILYAVIGLIVILLAKGIVTFVTGLAS